MTESFKKRRLESKELPACGMEGEEDRVKDILKKQNDFIKESINKIKSGGFGR